MAASPEPRAHDLHALSDLEAHAAWLERDNHALRALLAFGRQVNAELSLKALLALIPREVAATAHADAAAVLLGRADLESVGPCGTWGLPETFAVAWQAATRRAGPTGSSELALAAQVRGTLCVADLQRDHSLQAVRAVLGSAGVRRVVAAPLVARDEFLGVLVAYGRLPGEPDDATHAHFSAVADEAARAIQNARFYEQTQRELRRREALRRVVADLSSELDLDSLLERVVGSAVELLHATNGSISLVDAGGVAHIQAVHSMDPALVGLEIGPGQGITGHVLARRAAVLVADYPTELSDPLPPLRGVHASIAVPVWWQGQLTGVFAVFDSEPSRTFNEQDRETLELLADHVAIAIENARLYGEVRERLAEVTSLQRLGTLLLEEHDFDRVLQAICQQLQRLTDAGGVGLALLEENGQFLELRTVVGPSAEALRGARIPVEGSFAGEALRTNRPQRSSDALNDPRGYRASIALGKTRTIMSVPMKTRQRTVGVISIYNKRGGEPFTERDAELATLFANQAAVAIENARLYEQTREYAVIGERNRLARDLHDSVTQSLFSVTLLCQASLSLWDRDPPKARERLERANELGRGALAEMRALIFELRPAALQEEGLVSALKKHVAALRSREGLAVTLQIQGPERRLPSAVEEAAFRIAQESLNNVIKHARATRATVGVTFEQGWLRVWTEDDGVGFNPASRPKLRTMGMASMRERAEALRGTFRVETAPGHGARVCADLPIPPDSVETHRP